MPTDKPTLAALLCGLALLAGCTTTTRGTAVHASPPEDLFISCTIPDDALTAAGLDPTSEDFGFVGEQFTFAKVCKWDGIRDKYNISVFAMEDTLEQITSHPSYSGLRNIAIGDRKAVMFRMAYDPRGEFCLLGYTSRAGTVLFLGLDQSIEKNLDICTIVTDTARALDPAIPL